MSSRRLGPLVLVAVVALAVVALPAAASASGSEFVPPAQTHSHKVVYPTRGGGVGRGPAAPGAPKGSGLLHYGGGIDSIGVTTGSPRVYLVFWGSQWGTQTTGADGYLHFSGDPSGMAERVQALFAGIGTNGERWSGVMTQYCEGVAIGATSCSSSNPHVAYPSSVPLAGVWYDGAAAAPSNAIDHDVAVEAVKAAGQFSNVSASANRNAQYVIVSPTGTHPGGFNTRTGQFCAWHDYNGDTTLNGGAATSPYGDIAFTNLPYVTDMGASCGAGYVNGTGSAGALDGVTIVEGHEYAETITDQNPAGGWIDSAGYENADKCAWVGTGGTGGAQNVAFATGSFAMQATFANDGSACEISHAIVGTATNDFSMNLSPSTLGIAPGGANAATVNTAVVSGTAESVSLTVSGAPAGVTASFASNVVTAGSATTLNVTVASTTTPGSYTLTVTGTSPSVTHTAALSLTVTPAGGTGILNGGFESGALSPWTASGTVAVGGPAHSGSYAAVVGATTPTKGDSSVTQTFVAGGSTLSFFYNVNCPDKLRHDWATATLKDVTTGATRTVLTKTCTVGAGWKTVSSTLTAGHTYTLTLVSHDDNAPGDATYTLYDDVVAA